MREKDVCVLDDLGGIDIVLEEQMGAINVGGRGRCWQEQTLVELGGRGLDLDLGCHKEDGHGRENRLEENHYVVVVYEHTRH